MKLSQFAEHYLQDSGIFILMKDLDEALNQNPNFYMLGGGNPGFLPEMQEYFYQLFKNLVDSKDQLLETIGIYDSPLGNQKFREELAIFFRQYFGWSITKENIAITIGSQNAFYILMNLFSGQASNSKKNLKILFPICPEYIGYEEIPLNKENMISLLGIPTPIDDFFFRYEFDKESFLNILNLYSEEIGCIAISNPTNPTGRILSFQELEFIKHYSTEYKIPVIIDCAYGAPFPNIIYKQQTFVEGEYLIYIFSLSKTGMPGIRTGIVLANTKIIDLIGKTQAIQILSPNRIGAFLLKERLKNNEFAYQCKKIITPYYLKKRNLAIEAILNFFKKEEVLIHESEGAFFLWLVFPKLKINTFELYKILKNRNVIIVPGNFYYPNLNEKLKNSNLYNGDKSIRLSFSQSDEHILKGIAILAKTVKEYS